MRSLDEALLCRIKLRQKDIIRQAENELLLVQRETELSSTNIDLESIFYTYGKAAMMSAKFYHECKILKIPCVLDVHTQFGEIDAIIEMMEKFYLIEFKSMDSLLKKPQTQEQISRYLKHNHPVILITKSGLFSKMLIDLKVKKLNNKAYIYSEKGFKKLELSPESVDK